MGLKEYLFTEQEVRILRDACDNEYHRLKAKDGRDHSVRRQDLVRQLYALREQFADDARLMR